MKIADKNRFIKGPLAAQKTSAEQGKALPFPTVAENPKGRISTEIIDAPYDIYAEICAASCKTAQTKEQSKNCV